MRRRRAEAARRQQRRTSIGEKRASSRNVFTKFYS